MKSTPSQRRANLILLAPKCLPETASGTLKTQHLQCSLVGIMSYQTDPEIGIQSGTKEILQLLLKGRWSSWPVCVIGNIPPSIQEAHRDVSARIANLIGNKTVQLLLKIGNAEDCDCMRYRAISAGQFLYKSDAPSIGSISMPSSTTVIFVQLYTATKITTEFNESLPPTYHVHQRHIGAHCDRVVIDGICKPFAS